MRRALSLPLILVLLLTGCGGSSQKPETVMEETAGRLLELIETPRVGSTGGEWLLLGLTACGTELPEGYGEAYYADLEGRVTAGDGVLDERNYTEYARAVLALTALGYDPGDVAGHSLLTPLEDVEQVLSQGINGAIYALLALDSGEYMAGDGIRSAYVEEILSRALEDGGFALGGAAADPDVTAMAALALNPYRDDAAVQRAIDRAVQCLAEAQLDTGGYATAMGETADTVATVITALCGLGIDPDDERFQRRDRTLVDVLLDYYLGGGEFAHLAGDEKLNLMTTEQALMALAAYHRHQSGEPGIYRLAEAG